MAIAQRGDAEGGWQFRVWAVPGAGRSAVRGEHGGALRLAVAAPPEQGRANRALIELLAAALEVKRTALELVSGATSREKWIRVRGLNGATLAARLAALAAAARRPKTSPKEGP